MDDNLTLINLSQFKDAINELIDHHINILLDDSTTTPDADNRRLLSQTMTYFNRLNLIINHENDENDESGDLFSTSDTEYCLNNSSDDELQKYLFGLDDSDELINDYIKTKIHEINLSDEYDDILDPVLEINDVQIDESINLITVSKFKPYESLLDVEIDDD